MNETLSFHTNDELVDELLARPTFAGIIIKPKGAIEDVETKSIVQFDVMWSKRLPESTIRKLLSEALGKLGDEEDVREI